MTEAAKPVADKRTVQLKRVRLSFTDGLVTKKRAEGVTDGEPKYGCNVILEKGQPEFDANNAKVMAAIREAGLQEFDDAEAFTKIFEDNPKRVCYKNGSRFKNQDTGEIYKGYDGNMAFSASTPGAGQRRPKMFDRRKREVTEVADIETVMYGGSYADVIASFYGTTKGGRGIFAVIEGIRSHEEGEKMGGGVNVTGDMFDELPDDNSFDKSDSSGGGESDFIG